HDGVRARPLDDGPSLGKRAERQDDVVELAIHHDGVNEPEGAMAECPRERTDDAKTQTLPQPDGASVGAHDEVELHRLIALAPRLAKTMRAQVVADAAASRGRMDHEGRVGDVSAKPAPVLDQLVHADAGAVEDGHAGSDALAEPVPEGLIARSVRQERVRVAAGDHDLKDVPDGIRITRRGRPDHRRLLYRYHARSSLLFGASASGKNVVLECNRACLLVDPMPLQFEPGAFGWRRQQRNPAAEENRDHSEAHLVDQASSEEAAKQLPAA